MIVQGDDGVVRRAVDRIARFRDGRDLDAVLSAAAGEDLRRLYELPPDAETDLVIAWSWYCRFLSLGGAAEGAMEEALSRFLAPGRYPSQYLPRTVALLRENITAASDPAAPRHRAAVALAGAEDRIEALRQSSAPDVCDALLADLAEVADGDLGHNLALLYRAQALRARYEMFGDPDDLTEAIEAARACMSGGQADDIHVVSCLNTLGAALCDRYEIGRDEADLAEALDVLRLGLGWTALQHPARGLLLACYASALELGGGAAAAPEQRREHARLLREAVDATPVGHQRYVEIRQSLIVTLLELYKLDDDPQILREAAQHARDSRAALGPAASPDTRARLAVSTGRVVFETAQRTGVFTGWSAAERDLAAAIAALPPGHIYRPVALLEHGNLLLQGYQRFNQMSVLERAFWAFSDAERGLPPGDPNLPALYGMLAASLGQMAKAPIDPRLAEQYYGGALGWARRAVDGTSAEEPDLAEAWNNLSLVLRAGAPILRDDTLRAESIEILRAVLRGADTPRRKRMAATNLASALTESPSADPVSDVADRAPCEPQRLSELDEAAALNTLVLSGIGAGHSDHGIAQQNLAASLAERWRGTPAAEPGRDAYRQQAIALYGQISASPQALPHRRAGALWLAGRLRAEAGEWEAARAACSAAVGMLPAVASSTAHRRDQEFSIGDFSGLARDASACAIHLNDPVGALRLLEAGRGFLLGPGTQDERAGAEELARTLSDAEAVVVLNTSGLRCDAVVIDRSGVRAVPLPDLTWPGLTANIGRFLFHSYQAGSASPGERQQAQDEMARVLDWLWRAAVGPVLDILGHRGTPAGDAWPRVWWCPTGLLNFVPLHAAAGLGAPAGAAAIDRVVSSYTPTVRALASARRASARRPSHRGAPSLLTVTLPDTPGPGQAPLPAVEWERDAARAVLPAGTSLNGPQATRARILAEIPRHPWLLFGGHALQNASMPGSGALVPYDHDETDLVRIEDIRAMQLAGAELAVLSACETARGSMTVADEAVHLAGALQSAGFAHVIAAQWTVWDQAAANLTGRFFAAMQQHGFRPQLTALALHHAVRATRARDPRPATWASFMHFGP